SPYNYVPTESVTLVFLVLFGISTALHLGQSIWFKLWWLLPTAVLAGTGETIGWAGRFWSTQNILNDNAFLMQITTTIISPTPLLAANFIIFSRLVNILGAQYSRLSPVWCMSFPCAQNPCAHLYRSIDSRISLHGSNVMLAGIVFQLVALTIFAAFMAEYVFRFLRNRPLRSAVSTLPAAQPLRSFVVLAMVGLVFSTLVLFIRCVYRTIELADGWNGRIISTQVYFNVLDGAMVVLAMYT
ncbi:RTA-like protein, partial [Irpex lacteus]